MSKGKQSYWKRMICLCQEMLKVRRECLRSPKSILITNCNKLNRFPFHETFAFPIFKNEISNTGHNSVMKNNVKLFFYYYKGQNGIFHKKWIFVQILIQTEDNSSFLNNSIFFLSFSPWNNFWKFLLLCKSRDLFRHDFKS